MPRFARQHMFRPGKEAKNNDWNLNARKDAAAIASLLQSLSPDILLLMQVNGLPPPGHICAGAIKRATDWHRKHPRFSIAISGSRLTTHVNAC
jgi:hypothetical protein